MGRRAPGDAAAVFKPRLPRVDEVTPGEYAIDNAAVFKPRLRRIGEALPRMTYSQRRISS